MGPIAYALGPLYGKNLQYVMLDSWEAGMQNWTDDMLNEFKKRRGYDLTPFLPCLTGRVSGDSDISDRRAEDTEIYFAVNSSNTPLNTEIRFRVKGKEAEINIFFIL